MRLTHQALWRALVRGRWLLAIETFTLFDPETDRWYQLGGNR